MPLKNFKHNSGAAEFQAKLSHHGHQWSGPGSKVFSSLVNSNMDQYECSSQSYMGHMGVVQNTFSRTALNRSANRVATAVPQ